MKLTKLSIQNFRSCKDVTIDVGSMHALVGANGAGKSTVLRALDFLFNPTTKNVDDETFWGKDNALEIRVEARFESLSDRELEELKGYIDTDGSFTMARSAKLKAVDQEGGDGAEGEDKIQISQHYCKNLPKLEWLREVSGAKIDEWWARKEQLTLDGKNFIEFAGWTSKPKVGDWKDKVAEFLPTVAGKFETEQKWQENPKGYAGVLKGTLPVFVLVPAVRDIADESRVTKSNPFGRLLATIVESVTEEKKQEIRAILAGVAAQMNRAGGDSRLELLRDTESQLNGLLGEFFKGCDLEIEFPTPTLEVLLSAPKLYVDDGLRTAVENKGHGLQRAVIFTILRRYAEHMKQTGNRQRTLILAVEEPELYMHPQAQRTIRQVFRDIANGDDQVFFTTHSALLVDVSYFDEIIRMVADGDTRDGKKRRWSKAWQLPMKSMINDLTARIPRITPTEQSMRDLYSHAYNPRRNEGFFANRIILVEGATEEYSLPIYAKAIPDHDFDPVGVSVVECGGKGPMDRLYRIFNELRIPCYMLFDYDKDSTDQNSLDKSKELLALAGEPTEVPTQLHVGPRAACFPSKWEHQLRAEVAEFDQLTGNVKGGRKVQQVAGRQKAGRKV